MGSGRRDVKDELGEHLQVWRQELLDLSRRNRLLNFRHTKASTLEIREPGYAELLERLSRGIDFAPLPSAASVPGGRDEARSPRVPRQGRQSRITTQRSHQEDLDKALAALCKASRSTETETGIWILYLGVGFLRWKGPAEMDHSEAPLLLVPAAVDLTDRGRYRLCASETAEALINPALGTKLQEFSIDWSPVEAVSPDDPEQLIEAVRACVSEQASWSVEERTVLAPFTFHKETMYRDLKDNEAAILDHPVVQAIAASPDHHVTAPTLEYDLPPLEELDRRQEPETAPLVLDADSYQRRAVAAALEGRSFVIDGPPGTGKSQTITNIIAALIGAGRTVLFVSEKAAALEVVQSRLAEIHIDVAVLSLHDGKTKGGAVAKVLDAALHADLLPLPDDLEEERSKTRMLRERLSEHAEAVNEVDAQTGLSLNHAMGRIAILARDLPADTELGVVEPAPRLFPRQERRRLLETARSMTHVWNLFTAPEDSPWHGIRRPGTAQETLGAVLTALNVLRGHTGDLCRITGGRRPSTARQTRHWAALLEALTERIDVPGHWPVREEFTEIVSAATEAAGFLSGLARLRAQTEDNWQDVKALPTLAELDSGTASEQGWELSAFGSFTEEYTDGARRWCADWEQRMTETLHTLDEAARRTGLPRIDDHGTALRLTSVLRRLAVGPRPLPHWLADSSTEQVCPLLTSFVHLRDRLRESRARARELFHAGVLQEEDIAGLADRLRVWRQAGAVVAEHPEIPAGWLAATDFDSQVREPVLECWERRHSQREAAEELARFTPLPWHRLPGFDPADPTEEVAGLDGRAAAGPAREDARFFSAWSERLADVVAAAREAAQTLACPCPTDARRVRALLDAVAGAGSTARPLPAWLDDEGARDAEACLDHAERAVGELLRAREAASDLFTPRVLEQGGLEELNERLAGYRRFDRFLGSGFREDKGFAAALTTTGAWHKDLPARLPEAIRWQRAHQNLSRDSAAYLSRLGEHWQGEYTDFSAVRRALGTAAGLRWAVPESERSGLRRHFHRNPPTDPRASARAENALRELARWEEARPLLPPAAALHDRPLDQAAAWLAVAARRLTADASLVDALTPVVGVSLTTGTARAIRDRALRARHEDEQAHRYAEADARVLGSYRDLLSARTRQELAEDLDRARRAHGELRSAIAPLLGPDGPDAAGIESLRAQALNADPAVTGPEGGLGRAFHRDRLAAAGLTRAGTWRSDLPDRIGDALLWCEDHRGLESRAADLADAFGGYWAGEDTDVGALSQALDLADLCHGELTYEERTVLAHHLAHGDLGDLAEPLSQAFHALSDWPDTRDVVPGDTSRLRDLPLTGAVDRVKTARGFLELLHGHLTGFRLCTDRDVSIADADRGIVLARRRERAESERERREHADRELLGPLYRVEEDLDGTLRAALTWTRHVRGLIADLAGGSAPRWPDEAVPALRAACEAEALIKAVDDWEREAQAFAGLFHDMRRPDITKRFSGDLGAAEEFLFSLREDAASLDGWHTVLESREVLRSHGLGPLLDRYLDSQGVPELWPATVERAILQAWVDRRLREDGRVIKAPGPVRDGEISDFQSRDRGLHTWARQDILHRWAENRPALGAHSPGIGVIRREAEKKRRHMPVRRLMEAATWEAQRLTPCLMMSPLTVSRFLPPDIRFDVVVFDEASQVKPADAVNCLYRGESLIVAGDQKQLPPTDFFDRSTGDDEWDEEQQETFESLLDMCKASGRVRDIPLRWHYRSRHEGLIAFSNQKFYGGELITFPGARRNDEDTGVAFFKVDGVYDRGRARNNRIEADKVAERVIHHVRTRPDQTLGVVALSRDQADLIEAVVDKALDAHPELRALADGDRLGGFFVKNLETVQGDERDVIILSVGYGRAADGTFRQTFGPINRADGHRRLNVAITRAKHRVEVVASFSADELRVDEKSSEGLRRLSEYLRYAEQGPLSLEQPTAGRGTDAETESPFEESVLAALEDWGYEVHPQVGVAGYRIDLGVVDPDLPGRYAIGIECDGAMYHSSKVARDRDRLRERVLVDLGWRLHRIWGTDWYRDHARAEQRLREAVEKAVRDSREGREGAASADDGDGEGGGGEGESPGLVSIPAEEERIEAAKRADGERPAWLHDYPTSRYRPAREAERYEPRDPGARPYIAGVFVLIAEREGPVQIDWLYRRTNDAMGGERLSRATKENFDATLKNLVRKGRLCRDGDTIRRPEGKVEVRRPATDATFRKVGEVPPVERQEALRLLVRDSVRVLRADLLRLMRETFEWGRSGKEIAQAFDRDLRALLAAGVLTEENGVLHYVPRPREPSDP